MRLRERERERGPLSCDSAFHQGTGRQRHKTRHVSPLSSLPLPPPPLHPLSCPPFCTKPPPLPSASDLNIYQTTTCWNSSLASVSWCESQTTFTLVTHTRTRTNKHIHTHTESQPNLFWILLRCGRAVLVFPWVEKTCLETHTHTHVLSSFLFLYCTSCHFVLFI